MQRKNIKFAEDDFEDDQDEDEETLLMPEKETPLWDLFRDNPTTQISSSMASTKWFDRAEKFGRLFAILLTFFVVLSCAVISKGSLLFITSQIKANVTKGVCNESFSSYRNFEVTLPNEERATWIWLLCFIYWIPQLGTFYRSVRIIFFKSWDKPELFEVLLVSITEGLGAIGTGILVFYVLPELDVIKGAMLTNAMCFIPSILRFFTRSNFCKPQSIATKSLDVLSMLAQATGLVIWPLLGSDRSLWIIIVAILFISVGWWENFVSDKSFFKRFTKPTFDNNRYIIYAFASVWKSLLFFLTMLVVFEVNEGNVNFIFHNFTSAFQDHIIHIDEVPPIISASWLNDTNAIKSLIKVSNGVDVWSDYSNALWLLLINVVSTYLCYAFSKFACKVMIQRYSFAFPANLAVPTTITALLVTCALYNEDNCAYSSIIPPYLFFNIPPIYNLADYLADQYIWVWLLWLFSQCWITIYLWNPRCEKLSRTEVLFVRPMYDPFLIDQDIALNRRQHDAEIKKDDDIINPDDEHDRDSIEMQEKAQADEDSVTRIFACGTMWHETTEEMMEFLKSVMRLDEDQHARKLVKTELQGENYKGYYELETHVFFDDAFTRRYKGDKDPQVNEWVKMLVNAVNEAVSYVHRVRVRVRPPKKYITPYGGRLEWTLPGKTKMIAHLKDKALIRPKKRWSQVMYMYYLLGHRLMARDDLTPKSRSVRAKNTYILALDGDIDFQPSALHSLVDLMKKNDSLGAACGRIHPIGSGPMVWYQMFEYAVGHWLQKATEHVIGCVLCSPGCFSLFRGLALMDDNVMNKYTLRSTEPMHYVQYDQGEDRWLCTLLLQRGYRVEYSAASDAFTHCPEKFNEFYNQRRRWMPSTTANILDLLMDAKNTIKVNDNISRLYIVYQIILMIGTILGPGTIFLMLVGAFVAAFQTDQWTSFILNCVPILIFVLVCALFKNDKIQLFFASLISAIYGLVMMAVLVGVMLQISQDGPLAPSSLFLFCVAFEFIFTACMHPKEFNCLPYGIIYYVTVPSMYMILVIYSVFNMNNVSWGTREVTVVTPESAEAANKAAEASTKKDEKQGKIKTFFGKITPDNVGAVEFSLAGLFKCLWCTHQKEPEENKDLQDIKQSLNLLMNKLDMVESQPIPEESKATSEASTEPKKIEEIIDVEFTPKTSFEMTNSWIEDEELQRGEVGYLAGKEKEFWNSLIEKYLHPIDDTEDKDRIQSGLIDLRDKTVFAFFMINSLFVLVIFLLTLKKDLLHLKWPLGVKRNITYMEDEAEVIIENEYLELEPIGFVFLIFFASLMIVQFFAMLIHRFKTFSQIISTTKLNWSIWKRKVENMSTEEIKEDPLFVAKELQKLEGINMDEEDEKVDDRVGHRKIVHNLLNQSKEAQIHDLDQAVARRIALFDNNKAYKSNIRRQTMAAISNRRKTEMHRRQTQALGRASVFQPVNANDFEDF